LKHLDKVAQNVPLSELGMDSMMAVEIKQTLEREFDVVLAASDIRILNFAKLKEMTDSTETKDINAANKTNFNNLQLLTTVIEDSDLTSDIAVEVATKKEIVQYEVFLLPGIEGCASVYKSIASKLKPCSTCLQHGVFNIPGQTRSVTKSASCFLPV